MVILPLNVEASFPKWFPDFVKFEFKYSNKLLEIPFNRNKITL